MNTRDKIIGTAIALFNESGTKAVTTNHIAKALDISPGNLYYYFKNKSEIIRAVMNMMIHDTREIFPQGANTFPTIVFVKNAMEQTFQFEMKYRFFYRELITLIRDDAILHVQYNEIRQQKLKEISTFVNSFLEAGYLCGQPGGVYDRLIKTAWMVFNYWLVDAELGHETITQETIKDGIIHIFDLFEPFMSRDGVRYYQKLKERWRNVR